MQMPRATPSGGDETCGNASTALRGASDFFNGLLGAAGEGIAGQVRGLTRSAFGRGFGRWRPREEQKVEKGDRGGNVEITIPVCVAGSEATRQGSLQKKVVQQDHSICEIPAAVRIAVAPNERSTGRSRKQLQRGDANSGSGSGR